MNSVGSQFARAVKVWLRDTASLSFTHRAILRLVTRTVLTLEGGGGGGHLEYSPSLTVGRTSSTTTNCSSKVGKIRPAAVLDLDNEATEPFCIPHARFARQSDIYFKTLFLSVPFCIDHRRFTAGIKLFHTGNVHAHLSPRLVAGLQAVPYTHCEKFCQFHEVSRSSPICSVSVLCHSVHIHSSNVHTLAQHCMCGLIPPLAGEKRTKIHSLHKAWPVKVTVFSFFAHFYSYYLLLYLYYVTYRLLQKPAAVAVAVAAAVVVVHSYP